MKIKANFFKKAAISWYGNDPFSQSAAIAYYTIFSFPALVFIYLALASLFTGEDQLQEKIIGFFAKIVGKDGTKNIESIIESTAPSYTNLWALAFGLIILLFAGLKLFLQLQKTLNMIWGVRVSKHVSIWAIAKQRAMAFAVMMGIGFIMLASLFITTILSTVGDFIADNISENLLILMQLINVIISICTISFLFTVLLKLLPDVEIHWNYAWAGGVVSAILFIIGEHLLGFYFDIAEPGSAYGATASIILLMLWVSYTGVILLFGAEFTKVVLEYNKAKPVKTTKLGAKQP